MKTIKSIVLVVSVLLLSGTQPLPRRTPQFERELAELTQRGITHRFLDDNTIELTDPLSGFTRIKTLQEPSTAEIYTWANDKGIPILEIDPTTIDTNQYTGMVHILDRSAVV
jgi:hypothetical protein